MTKTGEQRCFRVLLIAEAANPETVSVPLVGWSLARALADLTDAHLVTQIRNKAAIERTGWRHGHEFTAIDSEAVARRLHKLRGMLGSRNGKGWTLGTALNAIGYPYFEHLVWKQFGPRLKTGEFDLVHRITPLSPTVPSPIASKLARIGVPFVLGPLNGGLPWPKQFDRARRAEREWLSYVRSAYKLMPGYHATRRHASTILIASKATWEQMPPQYHHKCVYLPENGIDPARFNLRRTRRAKRPIRCVFVGRLVPYKGPDMLLEAAAPLLKRADITLQYIGDGPLMPQLRQQVESQHVPGVEFLGWVEHKQVQQHLVNADLLTFPSIREFGGGVVLEAMALGVPPLIVDYGGPAELVTPETGFTVPIGSRQEIIGVLRSTLERIAGDSVELAHKSTRALWITHNQFTWAAKGERLKAVYADRLELPRTGMTRSQHNTSTSQQLIDERACPAGASVMASTSVEPDHAE